MDVVDVFGAVDAPSYENAACPVEDSETCAWPVGQ
jgi:hypothetical protein